MKQAKLSDQRDYRTHPRSSAEAPDPHYRDDYSNAEGEVSRTKQSEAEACDINNIMKKYQATGFLPDSDGRVPQFEDFSTRETFHEAMEIVAQAQTAFSQLDAEVRKRFGNDPAELLALLDQAATDPKAGDELIRLGLAEPRPEPAKPAKIEDKADPAS